MIINSLLTDIITVMEWSGRTKRTGHRQRSQSKSETTAGGRQRGFIVQQQTIFSTPKILLLLQCCFTSTEAIWLIRDGDRGGRGRKSEGSTTDTARKRPERPWTAARTMEVLSPFLIGRMFLREPSWKYSAKLVGS